MDGLWILLGMMGSGKSTTGRELARLSDRPFQDTDDLLEHRLGRSISSIFRIYGESAFRDHETSILRSLERRPGVLATGGGVVLRDENWTEMKRLGTSIYLDLPIGRLKSRLSQSKRRRPLLEFEDWEARLEAMLNARRELYLRADFVIPIDVEEHEEAAKKILAAIEAGR